MKEKKYEKRLDFQQKLIDRQSEQIEKLKLKIARLEEKCKEKDEIINSVQPMREELTQNIKKHKRLENEYESLIQELKQMRSIINETVYNGKWKWIKWLIK